MSKPPWIPEVKSKMQCDYPGCKEDSLYAPRKKNKDEWLHLCEEHYYLWSFMDRMLFEARIEINLRKSRFVFE